MMTMLSVGAIHFEVRFLLAGRVGRGEVGGCRPGGDSACSLMPSPCVPPREKWSGGQNLRESQISWAYSPKVVMTNEMQDW